MWLQEWYWVLYPQEADPTPRSCWEPQRGKGISTSNWDQLDQGSAGPADDYIDFPTTPFFFCQLIWLNPLEQKPSTSSGQPRSVECSSMQGSEKSHVACHLTFLERGQGSCISGEGTGLCTMTQNGIVRRPKSSTSKSHPDLIMSLAFPKPLHSKLGGPDPKELTTEIASFSSVYLGGHPNACTHSCSFNTFSLATCRHNSGLQSPALFVLIF